MTLAKTLNEISLEQEKLRISQEKYAFSLQEKRKTVDSQSVNHQLQGRTLQIYTNNQWKPLA